MFDALAESIPDRLLASFDLSSLDPSAPLADVGSSDYLIPAAIVGGLALIWWLLD
jgi:hypothetical protein